MPDILWDFIVAGVSGIIGGAIFTVVILVLCECWKGSKFKVPEKHVIKLMWATATLATMSCILFGKAYGY